MAYVKQQSHLGKSLNFNNGELVASEDLVLDCNYAGTRIDAGNNTVVVGLNCTVSADINGGVVEIVGGCNGNITASHSIMLANTAVVNGSVKAPLIRIEKHARFQGQISYV
jgi:cytoskeletal protein CcmA (bactofilin family)